MIRPSLVALEIGGIITHHFLVLLLRHLVEAHQEGLAEGNPVQVFVEARPASFSGEPMRHEPAGSEQLHADGVADRCRRGRVFGSIFDSLFFPAENQPADQGQHCRNKDAATNPQRRVVRPDRMWKVGRRGSLGRRRSGVDHRRHLVPNRRDKDRRSHAARCGAGFNGGGTRGGTVAGNGGREVAVGFNGGQLSTSAAGRTTRLCGLVAASSLRQCWPWSAGWFCRRKKRLSKIDPKTRPRRHRSQLHQGK